MLRGFKTSGACLVLGPGGVLTECLPELLGCERLTLLKLRYLGLQLAEMAGYGCIREGRIIPKRAGSGASEGLQASAGTSASLHYLLQIAPKLLQLPDTRAIGTDIQQLPATAVEISHRLEIVCVPGMVDAEHHLRPKQMLFGIARKIRMECLRQLPVECTQLIHIIVR